ncbi:hypothetical protein SELMODRAFT_403105 [Selaginella moellendorffii]|uniref:Uncharacterized protein n=1 Tax=Selaginella moellendorffii TaxID=88036 RepID=D8QP24_SELML|nr:hypothetical protein SELMODRAFT_403105 [Selaginella moellendorffii]
MYKGNSIVRTSKRMSEKPASTLYADVQMHSFHPSPLLQRITSKSYLYQLHINSFEHYSVCPLSPTGSVGNVVLAWNYHALCHYSCRHSITRKQWHKLIYNKSPQLKSNNTIVDVDIEED